MARAATEKVMVTPILDDDAVVEIEARHGKADGIVDEFYASEFALSASLNDIPALCATVRALRAENERLKGGDFTADEFQNLCHNTDIQAGFDAFADGCEAYQKQLFGRCRKGTAT